MAQVEEISLFLIAAIAIYYLSKSALQIWSSTLGSESASRACDFEAGSVPTDHDLSEKRSAEFALEKKAYLSKVGQPLESGGS